MGFIYSCEVDGLVSSTPNRLARLERAMKRTGIKPINASNRVWQNNSSKEKGGYYVDPPAYTAPLLVKPNKAITDWETSAQRLKLAYLDSCKILLEELNEGSITQAVAKKRFEELKQWYKMP